MIDSKNEYAPTVVIADDDRCIQIVLKRSLEECNCNVVATADNGETAIELLESHEPDIIFLDIQMPVKNGFEVLDIIKERNISVCSIMLSAQSSKENLIRAVKKGALTFLVKPHTQDTLEKIIDSYRKNLNC